MIHVNVAIWALMIYHLKEIAQFSISTFNLDLSYQNSYDSIWILWFWKHWFFVIRHRENLYSDMSSIDLGLTRLLVHGAESRPYWIHTQIFGLRSLVLDKWGPFPSFTLIASFTPELQKCSTSNSNSICISVVNMPYLKWFFCNTWPWSLL